MCVVQGIEAQIANGADLIAKWGAMPGSPAGGAMPRGMGGEDWTQSEDGMRLVQNVWEMVQIMKDFDEPTVRPQYPYLS